MWVWPYYLVNLQLKLYSYVFFFHVYRWLHPRSIREFLDEFLILQKALRVVHVYHDFLKMDGAINDDELNVDDFEYGDVFYGLVK